jgi:molybdate transport system ATP-binding protein
LSLAVGLRHSWGEVGLDIAFEAPTPGVVALFGPSGSGKSSTALAAAGLWRPGWCRVAVDGTVLADTGRGVWVAPERRRLGVVFQDARLFPHLSVAGNLRYGLRRAVRRAPSGSVGFETVVDLLGLGALLRRRPATLSGGERQRVAIGRALLAQPRLLVMDEPLASLDAARRAEILPYLARLRDALALPILYVTHALDELARLADTVVLLDAGRVVDTGPVAAIATRADLPLAARDDAAAVLLARVAGHDPARGLTRLEADGVAVLVPLLDRPAGSAVRVRVPAREVALARDLAGTVSFQNLVPGRVRRVVAGPRAVLVEIAAGEASLLSRVTPDAAARLGLGPGVEVVALFKSVGVEVS